MYTESKEKQIYTMEDKQIITILLIICIISLTINIIQAYRREDIYNTYEQACKDWMIKNNCIDNDTLMQQYDTGFVHGEAWQINNEVVYK